MESNIVFYIGGGLGDIVHHFSMGHQPRLANQIKIKYGNTVFITCYVYSTNPEVFKFMRSWSAVDEVVELTEPIYDFDEWCPPCGGTKITEWAERHKISLDEEAMKLPLGLPVVVDKSLNYLNGFIEEATVIHPFAHNIVKTFLDDNWWIDFTWDLVSKKNEKVLIIGDPDDCKCPLLSGFWSFLSKAVSPNLRTLLGREDFLSKVNYVIKAKAMVSVDSCWMNVANLYSIPSIVFVAETFYDLILYNIETSPYDYTWYPYARDKLRIKGRGNLVILEDADPIKVVWGCRYGDLPSVNDTLKAIHEKIRISKENLKWPCQPYSGK